MDERHQVGRVGFRFHREQQVPVVRVGHSFAIENGGWVSPEEYWSEFLTKPFTFRRSPENPIDTNAIMVTSFPRGRFLGFLSKELGRILSPLVDEGECALFGTAGHISVEIAESADISSDAKLYLEWLEEALLEYHKGTKAELLPRCPLTAKKLK